MAKRLIKSAEELDEQNDENQFELDESIVDEVSNAEEFADVEITNDEDKTVFFTEFSDNGLSMITDELNRIAEENKLYG